MFKYLTVLLSLYAVNAQVIVQQSCPDLDVQQSFVLSQFFGIWYEAEKYPVDFEEGGSCISHTYSLIQNVEMDVQIEQLLAASGEIKLIDGTARLGDNTDEAKFIVNLPVGPDLTESPYWVLETDYDNYAVVWSCVSLNETTSAESSWILTRERSPSTETLEKAYNVFDTQKISRNELTKTVQENC